MEGRKMKKEDILQAYCQRLPYQVEVYDAGFRMHNYYMLGFEGNKLLPSALTVPAIKMTILGALKTDNAACFRLYKDQYTQPNFDTVEEVLEKGRLVELDFDGKWFSLGFIEDGKSIFSDHSYNYKYDQWKSRYIGRLHITDRDIKILFELSNNLAYIVEQSSLEYVQPVPHREHSVTKITEIIDGKKNRQIIGWNLGNIEDETNPRGGICDRKMLLYRFE